MFMDMRQRKLVQHPTRLDRATGDPLWIPEDDEDPDEPAPAQKIFIGKVSLAKAMPALTNSDAWDVFCYFVSKGANHAQV